MRLKNQRYQNKFSEQTVKRVVFLVLLVVMSVSIFNIDTYYDQLTTYGYSIVFLNNLNGNYNLTIMTDWIKDFQIQNTRFDLIEISNTGTNPFDYIYQNTLVCKKNGTCAKKKTPFAKKMSPVATKNCHPLKKK